MAVTPRTFFQPFAAAVFNGVHNFATHTLKIALTNVEPLSTYANLSQISQIAAGGGYTTGGFAITTTSSAQASGVYKLILQDYTLSATGTIAEWQYAVLYNDTAAGDPLISWYTFAVPFNLTSGDTFPFDFDGINGTLNFAPGGAGSGSVTLAVAPSSVMENGTGSLVFTFTRSGVIAAPLTVNYTIGGTAVNGTDYNTIGASVVTGTGNTSANVNVMPINNTGADGGRTVSLQLAAGAGYVIGTAAAVVGTIEDDEAPAFSPADLSPTAWWDASDALTITESGGAITDWADKSGNGWTLSQATSGKQPTYDLAAINGLNAALWPSGNNDDFLQTAAGPDFTIREFYAVIKFANSDFSNYEGLLNIAASGPDGWFVGNASGGGLFFSYPVYINGNNTTDRQSDLRPEMSSTCLIRWVRASAQTTTAGVVLGMDRTFDSLNRGWNGHICEVAAYPALLDSTDRATLETYLIDKWGI